MSLARIEFLFVFCLTLPASAHTQVPGVKEDTPFRVSGSPNSWFEVVHNQGSSPLEAFISFYSCSNRAIGGLLAVYDFRSQYPGGHRSIPPSTSVETEAADPADCAHGIKAAIYSDGHVEGGSKELRQLFDRRKGTYEGLGVAIPLLDEVAEGQRTTPQLMDKLEALLAKERKALRTPETEGYETVYEVIELSLNRGWPIHWPSDDTPSKVPHADDVMKTQRVSLEQARAIVLSQKLKEWRSALEGHTEMP